VERDDDRPALPPRTARGRGEDELLRSSGTHFDPRVVEALVVVLAEGEG
jgi:response regulator RpfG family c-di-GMP phosphodiesterase